MMICKKWETECLPDVENPDGPSLQGKTFEVFIDDDELLRLLANYDPESGTSPSVADSRPVLRAILDSVSEV